MSEDKDTELADTLAEVGRRVGQAMTDALERVRPAIEALAEVANRAEIRAVIDRAEKLVARGPACASARELIPLTTASASRSTRWSPAS